MNRELLTLYGLKWNPFAADIPVEGLLTTTAVDNFCNRVENNLVRQGGFAMIVGEPGAGKSVVLRLLAGRLARRDDITVAAITHPSSSLGNFYREMTELFGIDPVHNNHWLGFKGLRHRWLAHFNDSRAWPVLLIDEAQEVPANVLAELRLLVSAEFDTRTILSVVFAGDERLLARLRSPALPPIASRIRQPLILRRPDSGEMARLLDHLLREAGNPVLMTDSLKDTLVARAGGNPRALAIMADSLLDAGARANRENLDEKLFLELFGDAQQARRTRR